MDKRSRPDRPPIAPDKAEKPFVLSVNYGAGEGAQHAHRHGQLVHAADGVLTVSTPQGRWVAPPQRAVWVPGGVEHAVTSRRAYQLLTLYAADALVALPQRCVVVAIDRLVDELLKAAAVFGAAYPQGGPEERLMRVLLDRLPVLSQAPLMHLPEPVSAPLRKIARQLRDSPAADHPLEALARKAGMSQRTLARRFQEETGMTLGRWRQHTRLLVALEKLAEGASVTQASLEVGYDDTSSFIAVFRAATGTTPARLFKSPRARGE